jgi:hypothetical protein
MLCGVGLAVYFFFLAAAALPDLAEDFFPDFDREEDCAPVLPDAVLCEAEFDAVTAVAGFFLLEVAWSLVELVWESEGSLPQKESADAIRRVDARIRLAADLIRGTCPGRSCRCFAMSIEPTLQL